MSEAERRRHATVITGLSRGTRNSALMNEVDDMKDLPTPERAEELLELAKDMEPKNVEQG